MGGAAGLFRRTNSVNIQLDSVRVQARVSKNFRLTQVGFYLQSLCVSNGVVSSLILIALVKAFFQPLHTMYFIGEL